MAGANRQGDVVEDGIACINNDVVSVSRFRSGLQHFLATTTIDALKTYPAGQLLVTIDHTIVEHGFQVLQLQALSSCLVHAHLRWMIVTLLRRFMLELMMRLTDPVLVLHEQ